MCARYDRRRLGADGDRRSVGRQRAEEAARGAISSPLLEASIEGARGVLLSVAGESDLGLHEANRAAETITRAAHPEANIIFGAVVDDALGEEVRVTVIAAGFDKLLAAQRRTYTFHTGSRGCSRSLSVRRRPSRSPSRPDSRRSRRIDPRSSSRRRTRSSVRLPRPRRSTRERGPGHPRFLEELTRPPRGRSAGAGTSWNGATFPRLCAGFPRPSSLLPPSPAPWGDRAARTMTFERRDRDIVALVARELERRGFLAAFFERTGGVSPCRSTA